jgi:hypothetical protein
MLATATASPLDLLTALLADPPDLSIVADPVAWATVRQSAGRHGVGPLVASIARPHVSGVDREWCDGVLMRSWRRHVEGLGDLKAILTVLQEAGIPCLVLKGPVLARRYYEPAFLRKPSVDIDLAVKKQDLGLAIAALEKQGYSGEWPLKEVLARSHHFAMEKSGRPGVELHFRLSHGAYGIAVEEFLERAVRYELPGGPAMQVLSPADEILHLVLHRAHGRFATLFHFYEIRKLWKAASPAVQEETLRRAVEHHFAGTFALTDAGFRARWKEPFLPPNGRFAKTWLQGRINEELYLEFERLSDPGRDLPLGVRLARRWLDLQLTDRPSDAARFAANMLGVGWFQLWRAGWRTVRVEKSTQ